MDSHLETQPVDVPSKRIDRRTFLKLCTVLAATLALPLKFSKDIAKALAAAPRLPVIWLEFQDCTGNTESFLRAGQRADLLQANVTDQPIVNLLLDVLSLDYHETIMAAAGAQSDLSLYNTVQKYPGQFLAIVEGAIPTANNGVYCTIGGRTALSIAQDVLPKARAVIAMGSCAYDGGLPAAAPNPTGAVGVKTAVPSLANFVALPGCPANVVNLVSTIVYMLTFNALPARSSDGRPLFAYGQDIHEHCERLPHFEAGRFVQAWGDAGHRAGWCLNHMGCKGPATTGNCPTVKFNDGTCWPVQAGHGCIGCTASHFWDTMSPFSKIVND